MRSKQSSQRQFDLSAKPRGNPIFFQVLIQMNQADQSMNKPLLTILLFGALLSSCIGDDVIFDTVEETLKITNAIDTLAVGGSHTLETRYTNNIGALTEANILWSADRSDLVAVDATGTLTGLAKGTAQIFAEVLLADNSLIGDTLAVVIDEETILAIADSRSGSIATTTFYTLEGDFELIQDGENLLLNFADNYEASSALPGLYLYLTNNPNTTAGALEIGKVETFSGTHSYEIEGVDIGEYDFLLYFCKPFRVKVGDGSIN